jgi:RNA polymerase sigma-70 factor (ECF subfamily)
MRAWLLQVTRNACIDQLRRRRRTAEIIALRPRDAAMIDGASSAPSPEQIVEGSQIGSSIHAALANLTESARGVVILREIQGLSYAEISDVLNISVDSVRVTLHRARRRLRESLKEVSRDVAAG